MIRETAAEIAKGFPIEMKAIGIDKSHIHLLCSAHEDGTGTDRADLQKPHSLQNLSTEASRETSAVGGSFGRMGTMW